MRYPLPWKIMKGDVEDEYFIIDAKGDIVYQDKITTKMIVKAVNSFYKDMEDHTI